jgi:hypothetical protein
MGHNTSNLFAGAKVKNKPTKADEMEQMVSCYEFLQQFSTAEQAQLMGLLESLVSQGELLISEDHPLWFPFDQLAKYISRQIDELPVRRN